jgi:hypothetical protein
MTCVVAQWSAVSRLTKYRALRTLDRFEDVAGVGGPNEWLGTVVVLTDILVGRYDQLLDIVEGPAAELFLSEIAEEALHHVEPRAAGRSAVVHCRLSGAPEGRMWSSAVGGATVKLSRIENCAWFDRGCRSRLPGRNREMDIGYLEQRMAKLGCPPNRRRPV